MNNLLAFDFNVNKENKTIIVKREFDAEVPLVWDAFTKKEILDQWWAPKPWKSKTKVMEFAEGGTRLYAMVGPKGEEHWSMFAYEKIEMHKRFTGFDGFTDSNGVLNPAMPRMHWDVRFNEKETHTQVEILITLADLAQLEAIIAMGFKEGFTMTLNSLDDLLPTLKK